MILTSGDPREVLQPFNFGQVNQITFAQAGALQQMVQQATGAVDSAGIAGQVNGEATAAGISMSLGAIIKRHKRTLINFQQSFLIPFVKKAAYRYMQFDPENYPVADYKFNASSTLGIIAREYEVTQLVQLLQTMQKDSPLYNTLIQSIIDNMNLSNREELLAAMAQAMQPNPEAQQMAMAAQQAQLEFQQSQTAALAAQAQESAARAGKLSAEANAVPQELEIDRINAITRNLREGDAEDKEFERRMRVAETLLKERQIKGNQNANRPRTQNTPATSRQNPRTPMALLEELDRKVEALTNAQKQGPKTSTSGVSGYNKPKRTPNHPTKKFVVVAKEGDKTKTIRFGDAKMKIKKDQPARRKSFRARHRCDTSPPVSSRLATGPVKMVMQWQQA